MAVPLRIGVIARTLNDPQIRGWNRYTLELLIALARRGVELVLYSDRQIAPGHLERLEANPGSCRARVAPTMRYFRWEQSWLPRACREDGVDILHSPLNFGLPWFSPCPRIMTLHDAIARAYQPPSGAGGGPNRASFTSWFQEWRAKTRADRIITVSEHAKADIVDHYGIPASRITVTYEAADERFHLPVSAEARASARRRYGLDGPYVFYIGGWENRKNIPFLVRAFASARLDGVQLALAGGRQEQTASLRSLGDELGLGRSLSLLGWVEDEDLPALYSEAVGFVYPSVYEGFGLQLCEAMAAGCPVLAARASCLPEILGDGGETFSVDDTEELTSALRRLVTEPTHRDSLVARARRRSNDFTWEKTAEQTIAVYEELLESRRRRPSPAPDAATRLNV